MASKPQRFSLRSIFGGKSRKIELEDMNYSRWNDPVVKQAYVAMATGHRDIDTTIEDKVLLKQFMERVIGQWHALGEADPHWSNVPMPGLKKSTFDPAALEILYDDGTDFMRTVAAFESRSGVAIKNGVCLDLGAGVGRYSLALAKRFERVIAVDVSAGGLRACEERARQQGITNVTTYLLTSPDDLAKFGEIDLFFSMSTLQHNPPPVQRLLVETALAQLPIGGFCLFQAPDWLPNYTFSNKRFLKDAPEASCDCHCLPKTVVLDVFEANNMRLLDIAPDFTVECFGSYTYFARKQAG